MAAVTMAVVTMAVVTMLWSNAKRGETGERERTIIVEAR